MPAGIPLPALRASDSRVGEHSGTQLPGLARALLSLQGPYQPRYPLVEIASALLSLVVAWRFGASAEALLALPLTWCLLALSLIDADHQLLPDVLVLPMLWLGLIVNAFGLYVPLADALWGAVAGYLSLWTVYWVFKLVTGKEGMGYGDFKLMALIGAWGGWQVLPLTLLLSSMVGALVGVCLLRLRRHALGTAIPFGLSGDCGVDCCALG